MIKAIAGLLDVQDEDNTSAATALKAGVKALGLVAQITNWISTNISTVLAGNFNAISSSISNTLSTLQSHITSSTSGMTTQTWLTTQIVPIMQPIIDIIQDIVDNLSLADNFQKVVDDVTAWIATNFKDSVFLKEIWATIKAALNWSNFVELRVLK